MQDLRWLLTKSWGWQNDTSDSRKKQGTNTQAPRKRVMHEEQVWVGGDPAATDWQARPQNFSGSRHRGSATLMKPIIVFLTI